MVFKSALMNNIDGMKIISEIFMCKKYQDTRKGLTEKYDRSNVFR